MRHLDCVVQRLKHRLGHFDALPDLRLQLLKLDAQLRYPLIQHLVQSVFVSPDAANAWRRRRQPDVLGRSSRGRSPPTEHGCVMFMLVLPEWP